MRSFSKVISLLLSICLLLGCTSCKKDNSHGGIPVDPMRPYTQYLGDYDYQATPAALVYEQIDGEEDGVFGIQYRLVEDLGGLSTQSDIAICLFFYSSLSSQTANIQAGVEDLAQTLVGQVLFVAIDIDSHSDISDAYGVYATPEFILLNDAARISTFDSTSREYWTIDDVVEWFGSNGYTPDYSMLE